MAKYIEYYVALQFVYDACTECMESCEEFDGIYPDCHQCPLEGVKLKLRHTHAADVRPVVRGKWKYRGQQVIDDLFPTYACSVCRGVIPADWRRKCNFCPNCGADMRAKPPKEETE